jgi:hypothetical protein
MSRRHDRISGRAGVFAGRRSAARDSTDHGYSSAGNQQGKVSNMLKWLGRRFTYANVMSTLAVFIALGGSSYAALTINGKNIKNRSISGTKLRHNTLTGTQIRESRLGTVPRAANAAQLQGLTAADFKVKCPSDTFPTADVCIEKTARAPAPYGSAVQTCLAVGLPAGPGRRLPTHGELMAALTAVQLSPGGELTSNVYPSNSTPGRLDVIYITDQVGSVALTPNTAEGAKAYRCVTDPLN